ncbi:acyl carrier protein [Bradyrhizobium zhanjiangense]|uniref:Acyl carrier protein n=1 Tax=Bradyrhizobium zhanjiangense TaxID=1325107 RepID=A0A4Q0SMM0_9BRAD|nr:acyl carrier protein [Bradyrhizobium zhanjiangense]RXH39096.1 acyl carrier protein [Bradyrhizobium zhanjiangense]
MDLNVRSKMRDYVIQRLSLRGDHSPVEDDELLFTSGRLDSLDAVEIIMSLEMDYGIDFARINFDLAQLDSINAICDLVDAVNA